MNLKSLGWNEFFEAAWKDAERGENKPARVLSHNREVWHVGGEFGETRAGISGKLRTTAEQGGNWPAVGDWVAVDGNAITGFLISGVLPRRTRMRRKVAGRRVAEQVLAANVDTVFLVMALDGDFNTRRVERYLAQVWECGARPVILLNKTDLCTDIVPRIAEVERCALGVPTLAISATLGHGIDDLGPYLLSGQTVVLLGSSGVGKSSVVNRLLGEEQQAVDAARTHDGRGRHTTTGRQLFFLGSGAMIIDTPGLRELQLWDAEAGLEHAFGELRELSSQCHFRNCRHQGEPGCAVAAAISEGLLDEERLENHRKLQREQEFLKRKVDAGAQQKSKQRIKIINRAVRQLYRQREEEGKS